MAKYSYNGVELAKLPDYDTDVYPYACVNESALVAGVYMLYLCSEPFYYSAAEGNVRTVAGSSLSVSQFDNDTWSWGEISNADRVAGTTGFTPLWCNVDILDEDGNVYLAASEPVAVKWQGLKSWLARYVVRLAVTAG